MNQQPLTVAGIGELLWDVLPAEEKLGGAPINFTYHGTALGAEGIAISSIGEDQRGAAALDFLATRHLDTRYISVSKTYPTGYVTARLDNAGVATYRFPDDVAWDHLTVNEAARAAASRVQAVCFGTLAQRNPSSRTVISEYIKNLPATAKRIFDINLRQNFYNREIIETSLDLCSILKLNDDELAVLSSLFTLSGNEAERLRGLRRAHDLELVILTRGASGSMLLTADELSEHPGAPAEVNDTIGAGDSFTAAVAIGLLLDRPLAEINEKANRLAAYVCGKSGAMPDIPADYAY